ncbi:MAG: hypothetical protein P9M12_06675 [Candidatus Aceula lacicola]|nr:hypothetical protein [Candidatus Aceula lacicola]
MKITQIRELLKDKRVKEEIHKHLWIESQKAGYSIGLERATDEWLRLYAEGWMKYHVSEKTSKVKKTAKPKTKKVSKPKILSKRKASKKVAKK